MGITETLVEVQLRVVLGTSQPSSFDHDSIRRVSYIQGVRRRNRPGPWLSGRMVKVLE